MNEQDYELERSIWTIDDYPQMGWHDANVHGIGLLSETNELAFDIDYIFSWIQPVEKNGYFKFWVAPATLVFENVNELIIDLEPFDRIQLQDLVRGDSRKPQNTEFINVDVEWQWSMDSDVGDITFWSIGYRQYVRCLPILTDKQSLTFLERGGLSFERKACQLP